MSHTTRTGFRRLCVFLLGLVLLIDVPGLATAQVATPAPQVIDGRFDIGGRSLYLRCEGMGQQGPTVVLEYPTFDEEISTAMRTVIQPDIAAFARVCSYDHAGLGLSDPAPDGVRTAQDLVDDLRALLAAGDIPGPYVLVGDGLGSAVVQFHARMHPVDVVGLVLVSPYPALPEELEQFLALIPENQRAAARALLSGEHPERIDQFASGAQLAAAPPLLPLPALVVVADPPAFPTEWPAEELNAFWAQFEANLTQSLGARREAVANSSWAIPVDQPGAVVAAISEVIANVHTTSEPTATPTG